MKKHKLSKLALAASSALWLAGCTQNTALKEFQKNAIQTKLAQMPDADAYVRQQMDGVQKTHNETITMLVPTPHGLATTLGRKAVADGLYLDLWAENDTNGTLVDEYVDYALDNPAYERETKAAAKAAFKAQRKQLNADRER